MWCADAIRQHRSLQNPSMKKILLLDDNADVLYIIEEVLTYEKFIVKSLSSSIDCIAIALDLSPDLILLDYSLNDSDPFWLISIEQAHVRPSVDHVS